jgi:hypothetical protein
MAITVKEVDGNPTLSDVTTLLVDQADGFSLSQPAPNQARLDLSITFANLGGTISSAQLNNAQDSLLNVSGTTTPNYATVFDLVNARGLHGSWVLKNTGTASLTYQISYKDMFGTTGTLTGPVNNGSFAVFLMEPGTAPATMPAVAGPPFQEIKLEVKDTGAGLHTTYQCYAAYV